MRAREANGVLEISNKTNLLEQKSYKYSLQDVADPNLYRDIYPYDHWVNCSAIANIFGSLDIIKEMKMLEE